VDINVDAGKALLVIVLTVVGVVLINLVIYAMVKGRGTIGQIEIMRKTVKQARDPWELEDNALRELSELVKKLKNEPNPADTIESGQQKPKEDS
jgi:hypothetical protein